MQAYTPSGPVCTGVLGLRLGGQPLGGAEGGMEEAGETVLQDGRGQLGPHGLLLAPQMWRQGPSLS